MNFNNDTSSIVYYVPLIPEAFYIHEDNYAWWIDSGATSHICKDRCWFNNYEVIEDGSVLYMGDYTSAPIFGRGSVSLVFRSENTLNLRM